MSATREHPGTPVTARTPRSGPPESQFLKALARRGDLVLAALVIAVISLLVVPLPTFLLDMLIATNLAVSISLLMLAVYIPSALGLSSFPSLLLLTTLFRLSLNIASTKLILLNGAAGHIIDTFGRMVVGGNVVVGLVVFVIIAIVQFIVIAKGAERVAEVGARFCLDGMPGKQMSIDADLRAGLIDKEETLRRRREVETESRLHGAMDGAMKFVKGDAIAGILIAFVNIVAGIAIGVSMHGLSAAEAVETYSVLSVGDGMVAQIPSLFVSIAAGIIITRVDGRLRGQGHLGAQIAREVLGHPTALLMAGAIVATFLMVPGLPMWPFLLLALGLAAAGYLGRKEVNRANSFEKAVTKAMVPGGGSMAPASDADGGAPLAVPLRVRIAPDLSDALSAPAFDSALEQEKTTLTGELGLPFPRLRMSIDRSLASGHYAIDVQEMLVSQGNFENSNVLPLAAAPANGAPVEAAAQREEGRQQSSREDILAAHVAWAVRRHADAFVGIQEAHELLKRAATQLPDLTAEVQKAVPVQRVAEVLRRLVEEGVSIRHLREICESLLLWGSREKDIVMLTEYVRVDLGRFTTHRYLDEKNQLRAVVLDTQAEAALRGAIQTGPSGCFLALAPDATHALMAGAESALSPLRSDGAHVVLAPMDVRRYLKKLLAARFPTWTVLSLQELPAYVQVQAVGRLAMQYGQQRRSA
jgi:type III secretion protein V